MANTQTILSTYGGVPLKRSFEPGPIGRTAWLIAAPPKVGKSSLVASVPRCLVLDYEDKIRLIPDRFRPAQYVVPKDLNAHDGVIKQLIADGSKGDRPFDTVAFDTANEFLYNILIPGLTIRYNQAQAAANKPGCPPGTTIVDLPSSDRGSKHWDSVTRYFLSSIRDVRAAGYGVLVTTHYKEEKVTIRTGGQLQETTVYKPALNPAVVAGLYRMAEFLATVGLKTVEDRTPVQVVGADGQPKLLSNGQPMMQTQRTTRTVGFAQIREKPGDATKELGSNLTLPPEIDLPLGKGWEAITEAYDAAVKAGQEL